MDKLEKESQLYILFTQELNRMKRSVEIPNLFSLTLFSVYVGLMVIVDNLLVIWMVLCLSWVMLLINMYCYFSHVKLVRNHNLVVIEASKKPHDLQFFPYSKTLGLIISIGTLLGIVVILPIIGLMKSPSILLSLLLDEDSLLIIITVIISNNGAIFTVYVISMLIGRRIRKEKSKRFEEQTDIPLDLEVFIRKEIAENSTRDCKIKARRFTSWKEERFSRDSVFAKMKQIVQEYGIDATINNKKFFFDFWYTRRNIAHKTLIDAAHESWKEKNLQN